MVAKEWQVVKRRYCTRAQCAVALEAEAVYPAEWMPEQPPHLGAHRCSNGMECMLEDKPACVWSGGNPAYDPFLERD